MCARYSDDPAASYFYEFCKLFKLVFVATVKLIVCSLSFVLLRFRVMITEAFLKVLKAVKVQHEPFF